MTNKPDKGFLKYIPVIALIIAAVGGGGIVGIIRGCPKVPEPTPGPFSSTTVQVVGMIREYDRGSREPSEDLEVHLLITNEGTHPSHITDWDFRVDVGNMSDHIVWGWLRNPDFAPGEYERREACEHPDSLPNWR